MLSPSSPFRRLPKSLAPQQMVYLDGIRHAAEISGFAYERLRRTLTGVVEAQLNGGDPQPLFIPAYIDAWATVDAIDRFRALLHRLPPAGQLQTADWYQTFRDETESIRSVRNITDHLESRVDRVLATDASALGTLSWLTSDASKVGRAYQGYIHAGTVRDFCMYALNPAGKAFVPPTDVIAISAGGYTASLSAAVRHVASIVTGLEVHLDQRFTAMGVADQKAGSDILVLNEIEFHDGAGNPVPLPPKA